MVSNMRMFTVDKFLGVDESADGYTELKMGQASRMENWTITDAYNLTVRPGIQLVDFVGVRTPAPIGSVVRFCRKQRISGYRGLF